MEGLKSYSKTVVVDSTRGITREQRAAFRCCPESHGDKRWLQMQRGAFWEPLRTDPVKLSSYKQARTGCPCYKSPGQSQQVSTVWNFPEPHPYEVMCPKLTRGNQITQADPKLPIFHVWEFSMGEGGNTVIQGLALGLGLWFKGKALALHAPNLRFHSQHYTKKGRGVAELGSTKVTVMLRCRSMSSALCSHSPSQHLQRRLEPWRMVR